MIKTKVLKYFFCFKRLFPAYNFYRIFFSIILAIIVLSVSFFIPDIRIIFANENSKILICIDPGHGGNDTGAIGPTGLKEKDVDLDIAIKLKNKLINAGFKVILTRESDINHSLDERVNFANSSGADLFIGVHNNAFPSSVMKGTQTFYCNQSPSTSNFLANYIHTKTLGQIGTVNKGVRIANFYVLNHTKMISALVEGAFISNPTEEAKLKDSNFRNKIAKGIYNGIIGYLSIYGKNVLNAKKLAFAQSFVKQLYQESLDIDPDQTTINNWASKLAAGTLTYTDFVKGVILGKQFADRNLGNEQYIDVLYKALLGRNPDSIGLAHWLGQLKTLSRKIVLNHFMVSDEFTNMVNQYSYSYNANTETTDSENIINLSVLNGVGTKGIAAKTSELFKELKYLDGGYKYKVSKVADADNQNYKNTQIICKSKDPEVAIAAQEIKTILKAGNITVQNGISQDSDIVIIIGKDYIPSTVATTITTTASGTSELILINILNGQGTQGIAAKVKNKIELNLSKDKNIIKITETKNADNFNYKKTKIIIFTAKTGIKSIAEDLEKFLGAGEILKSTDNVNNVDITIILGSDYK